MRFFNRNFFVKIFILKIFTYNICMCVCLVDFEDMFLVEILADLRKENEEEKIIDNDSMLGSQFSMLNNEIKEDNEDEEIEDLNITSLDLSSLSSWNSIITESESKKTEDFKQTEYVESTSRDLPQYDGSSDLNLKNKKQLLRRHTKNEINKEIKTCAELDNLALYFNNRSMILNEFINIQINFNLIQNQLMVPYEIVFDIKLPKYFTFYQKQTRKYKNKHRKMFQTTEKKLLYYRDTNMYKLDHQDLDVYDVDEVEHKLNNYKCLKHSIDFENNLDQISYNKLYVINSVLNKLNIPALDGNAVNTSSDSETDQDITINKEEKRVCVYNRLKKRRLEFEDPNLQSPHKRRNIIRNVSDESYHTPTKVKLVHSPCSISTKYSPLNIKIVSPKIDKNIKNIESSNLKSTYNILNRNTQCLSEEVNNFTSEPNQGK